MIPKQFKTILGNNAGIQVATNVDPWATLILRIVVQFWNSIKNVNATKTITIFVFKTEMFVFSINKSLQYRKRTTTEMDTG